MRMRRRHRAWGVEMAIGLGVGLSAMVFALADAYVWKPLPYRDADRLVAIGFDMLPSRPAEWMNVRQADLPTLESWRARTEFFEDIAAFEDRGVLRVVVSGRVLPLQTIAATDNLLALLGVEQRWGDSDPSAAWVSTRVASLLDGVLKPGRSAALDPEGTLRVRSTIPTSFVLPHPNRTLPLDAIVSRPDGHVMRKDGPSSTTPIIIARTRPGADPAIIEAALTATMPAGRGVFVRPLDAVLTERLRGLATGAMLASGLLLVVCWTNVFSMALTRGLYRRSDLMTRVALGATPGRIVSLLAREGLHVGVVGCVAALAVTWIALSMAVRVMPPQFASLGAPAVTLRVVIAIGVAASIAGLIWVLASVVAWRVGTDSQRRLVVNRDGRAIRAIRFSVVAAQVTVACVLLAGAGLLGRSYLNLITLDVGMDKSVQAVTVSHNPSIPAPLRHEVIDRTMNALRREIGVVAVGASNGTLVTAGSGIWPLRLQGHDLPVMREGSGLVDWSFVTGDYFGVMGLQFLVGGLPADRERPGVVVSESVIRLAGKQLPVGAILANPDGNGAAILGVVRDTRRRDVLREPRPTVYEIGGTRLRTSGTITYVMQAADDAAAGRWEAVVRAADPMAVVRDSGTVGERLYRPVRDRVFATVTVSLFAVGSVLLTALGLASIVAYTVIRRTHEMAVRLALGATGRRVTLLVAGDALWAGVVGVSCGAIAAAWLSSTLESLLFGLRPADPVTFAITAAVLLGVIAVAALVPGIRAAWISPGTALGSD